MSDAIKSTLARRVLIGLSVAFATLFLILPLFSVLHHALERGWSFYAAAVSTPLVRSALSVTLLATAVAIVASVVFGLAAAWALTKFDFRGRRFLSALIDIPFSISPVIVGLAFLMMYGRLGWAKPALDALGDWLGTDIRIVFAIPGVILATVFVTFPFVSRELIPVLDAQGRDEEEAAALMGAGGWRIFFTVTLPHVKGALLYGVILCASRALGEFGAVSALSKTRGGTFTVPLEIDALYMSGRADDTTAAFAVSSILVLLAVAVLVVRNIFSHRAHRISRP